MYDGLYAIAFGVRISSANISNNIYKNKSNDWRRGFTGNGVMLIKDL